MMKPFFSFLACLLFLNQSYSTTNDSELVEKLKMHVYFLAHDSLEGRATGSKGEEIAARYIGGYFSENGISAAGDNDTYFQNFTFPAGREYGEKNKFLVNGKSLELKKDYFPLVYSANGDVRGTLVDVKHGLEIAGKFEDYKKLEKLTGDIFLINYTLPEEIDPHSEDYEYPDMRSRIDLAIEKGAKAVIFTNYDAEEEEPVSDFKRRIKESDIPVIFLKQHIIQELKSIKPLKVELSTDLIKIEGSGKNVIGYIDNRAESTVVLGAHYDHLGWGEVDGSRHRGEKAIHNGADDNASGVAVIMEMASWLKSVPKKNNNYLFIAFSGEEMGLFGSKSYVENPVFSLDQINYMINLDMVGRLKWDERKLSINGTGTSPFWNEVLDELDVDSLNFVKSESGVGPSDHTSFYLKDIPVLHFFTGQHQDYHKPEDDPEKVNYKGIESVMKVLKEIVKTADAKKKLAFTKTKDSDNENVPRFTVTLGVMPDYIFDGEGMRIDGVTEGKPANNAGILKGDIVVQMGEVKVVDMMSYMKGLSRFKKGDKTKVSVKRGEETMEFQVKF